ncbi:MAG: gliding motility-associated ABC transporter ATP-binding subunit GldA [Bacteroidota bacterium]
MSILVKDLTKTYGTQNAVERISFEVNDGEIVGFLGPNGAGKSTTMKIATCYLPPTSGVVEVGGFDVVKNPNEVKKMIGYLPEHNPLYLDMFVREYLNFIGKIHGIRGAKLGARIAEIISLCGLTKEQNKKIGNLSKGYRQRVGLAQALLHDPKVLILDEPTTGLDPNQIIEIRNLIKSTGKDKTVLFSSHIMQEVQALCDRVVVINNGKLVANDEIDALKFDDSKRLIIKAEFSEQPSEPGLLEIDGIIKVKDLGECVFRLEVENSVDVRPAIFKYATDHGLMLLGLQQEEASMETVFQELTKPDKKS